MLWGCSTHKGQLWTHCSSGEYVLELDGLCLTDPSASPVNGTRVQIHACQDFADQHWVRAVEAGPACAARCRGQPATGTSAASWLAH